MKRDRIYRIAKRRAAAKIGFYIHFAAFAFAIAAQAAINLIFTPQFWWFLFPAFGWGVGVTIHGAIVLAVCNSDLKKRMIEKEMRALSGNLESQLESQTYIPMNWKDA